MRPIKEEISLKFAYRVTKENFEMKYFVRFF